LRREVEERKRQMRERETMLIREAEKEKREVFSIFKVWFVKSS